MNRRQRHQESGAAEWGPARLLALLVVSALVALAVLTGLVVTVITTFIDDDPGPAGAAPQVAAPAADVSRQDALAAAPMPHAEPEAALPGPLATEAAGVLELPRPTGIGPAEVPTGFPRTPEGALAQLAAIDVTAMESGSVDGVRWVIADWAAPAAPPPRRGPGWPGWRAYSRRPACRAPGRRSLPSWFAH